MCEAYRQGIVHRDLKPDNILVERLADNEDEVKVLDFGIAKMLDAAEGDGSEHDARRDRRLAALHVAGAGRR